MPRVGSSPAFRRTGRVAPPRRAEAPAPADTGGVVISPEDAVRNLAPEAIAIIARIMRKPGRHAQAQLSAARTLMQYSVQEPAKRNEATIDVTLAVDAGAARERLTDRILGTRTRLLEGDDSGSAGDLIAS